MDPARAAILEAAWISVVKRKQLLTANIKELRSIIQKPGMDVHKVVREIHETEIKLALLDEIVEDASRG